MIELRYKVVEWVDYSDGMIVNKLDDPVLQYRINDFEPVHLNPERGWSDWVDVPTVYSEDE